jgi:hypothetical protein
LAEGLAVLEMRRHVWILLDVAVLELWIIALNGLMVAGLLVMSRNCHRRLVRLQVAAWAGILLSVPFVPPWDADNMRAYAATLPFIAALPMLGLSYWRSKNETWGEAEGTNQHRSTGVLVFSTALLCLQCLGLFLVGSSAALVQPAGHETPCAVICENAGRVTRLYVDPRNAVHLIGSRTGGDADRAGQFVDMHALRVWESASRHSLWTLWRGLSRLPDDTTLTLAFDIQRGGVVYLRLDSRHFPHARGQVAACGQVVNEGWIEWLAVNSLTVCRDQ